MQVSIGIQEMEHVCNPCISHLLIPFSNNVAADQSSVRSVRIRTLVGRLDYDFARFERKCETKMRNPPQSIIRGIQAHRQLPDTGKATIPAAAIIPPNKGATEGASSFFTTVSQKIIALYTMNIPPIINAVTANISWI